MSQVRRASVSDLEELAIHFDQYRQFYQQPADLPGAREFLRQRLAGDESVIFIAPGAGFTQLYPSFSSVSMRHTWILNDLYVTPVRRKGGIARALIAAAVEFARADGAKNLSLMTAVDNTPAQKLYESLGWRKNERFLTYNFALAGQ